MIKKSDNWSITYIQIREHQDLINHIHTLKWNINKKDRLEVDACGLIF